MDTRKPLARISTNEKYRPRTVKMPDSLWARFTDAALAEGESTISAFVRGCAVIGLEYRERERAFGTYGRKPGNTAFGAGNTAGRTGG